MKNLIFLLVFVCISNLGFSQSITLTPSSVGTNVEGKMWYDTPSHSFFYWNGTAATPLGGSGGAGVGWAASGTNISNTNTGNVGIGIASPQSKLHLSASGTSQVKFTNTFTGNTASDGLDIGQNYFYLNLGPPIGVIESSTPTIMNRENSNMEFGTNNLTRFMIKNDGTSGVMGTNFFEFGIGLSGKESNAGKIGYNAFGTNALTFVGAGTNPTDRKVHFFAEGGTTFEGEINRINTGAANMVPIAYGTIAANGAIISGTGNFTTALASTGVYRIAINGITNYTDIVCVANYESAPNFSSIYTNVIEGAYIKVSEQAMVLNLACGSFPTPPYPCLENNPTNAKFSFIAYKP
ncbi:MAG: hypothetical protein CFE22_03435 [Cytophagaceae bacterium BCCC1]|nr:MAG: hypothetical protein CFE22_03435 [Cytophagaceae bacterium BCCC1]